VKDAVMKAGPVILEPWMKVSVETPEQYVGDIMGNLTSRRAQIEGVERRFDAQVINCRAPLSEMFGYATQLRSLSQGRATYTMEFCSYDLAPAEIMMRLAPVLRRQMATVA